MPTDSLGIYNIESDLLTKIPNVKSFELPEKWNGYVVYTLDKIKMKDTSAMPASDTIKTPIFKKVNEDNGYHLIVQNLSTSATDTLKYVKDFELAKDNMSMIYHTTVIDNSMMEGVYYYNLASGISKPLATGEYQYEQLAISDDGSQTAFLQDKEDAKSYIPGFQLRYWKDNLDSASIAVTAAALADDWILNNHQDIRFSKDGSKLFFHTSPPQIIKDSTLLEDEIIQVEIWSYKDQRLQTQQNVEQEEDEKKGYTAVYHTSSKQYFQLANQEVPEVSFGDDENQNHRYAFGRNGEHYKKAISWEGFPPGADIYLVDQQTGNHKSVIDTVRGSGDISPDGKYLYWYNVHDTAYYTYNIASEAIVNISAAIPNSIVDELDDHPDFPRIRIDIELEN